MSKINPQNIIVKTECNEDDSDDDVVISDDESEEEDIFYNNLSKVEKTSSNVNPSASVADAPAGIKPAIGKLQKVGSGSDKGSDNSVHVEHIRQLHRVAANARNMKNVFVMIGSCPKVRLDLLRRGWVQKLLPKQLKYGSSKPIDVDRVIITKALHGVEPNFVWSQKAKYNAAFAERKTFYNKIFKNQNNNFAKRDGLAAIFEGMHWFESNSRRPTFVFPRCHILENYGDRLAFINDYRLTLCTSFIFFLAKQKDINNVFAKNGFITTEVLDFAIVQVQVAIGRKQHLDIDYDVTDNTKAEVFIDYGRMIQSIIRGEQLLRAENATIVEKYERIIKKLNNSMIKFLPHIICDGFRNIWVLKSVHKKRVPNVVMSEEKKILEYVDRHPNAKYVIQKYIERPMIVHRTKFNIHQFFLLTSQKAAVELWVYKDCYMKFRNRQFSIESMGRLSKGQKSKRNPELPKSHIWSLEKFQSYLAERDMGSLWDAVIYPGMVTSIKNVVNANMDNFQFERNGFELFSADFILTVDYHVVLLEIKAKPDLTNPTKVLKMLHESVVHDLLTGEFSLINNLFQINKNDLSSLPVILEYPKDAAKESGKFENVMTLAQPDCVQTCCSLRVNGKNIKNSNPKINNKYQSAKPKVSTFARRTKSVEDDELIASPGGSALLKTVSVPNSMDIINREIIPTASNYKSHIGLAEIFKHYEQFFSKGLLKIVGITRNKKDGKITSCLEVQCLQHNLSTHENSESQLKHWSDQSIANSGRPNFVATQMQPSNQQVNKGKPNSQVKSKLLENLDLQSLSIWSNTPSNEEDYEKVVANFNAQEMNKHKNVYTHNPHESHEDKKMPLTPSNSRTPGPAKAQKSTGNGSGNKRKEYIRQNVYGDIITLNDIYDRSGVTEERKPSKTYFSTSARLRNALTSLMTINFTKKKRETVNLSLVRTANRK